MKPSKPFIRKLCMWWDTMQGAERVRFMKTLRRNGWRQVVGLKAGCYKDVFILNKELVLKFDSPFDRSGHTRDEWRVWKKSSVKRRQYYAKCYHYHKGMLIQEYVGEPCKKKGTCRPAQKIAEEIEMLDWDHNHAHRTDGRIVFWDYDLDSDDDTYFDDD